MMLALAFGAAFAAPSAPPPQSRALPAFELPPAAPRVREERAAPFEPLRPRNLNLRDSNAPEAQWQIAEGGPMLVVGAMGGRRSGMPKLAHVAVDWTF